MSPPTSNKRPTPTSNKRSAKEESTTENGDDGEPPSKRIHRQSTDEPEGKQEQQQDAASASKNDEVKEKDTKQSAAKKSRQRVKNEEKFITFPLVKEGGEDEGPPPSYKTIRDNPSDPLFFNDFLFALLSFKIDHGNFSVDRDVYPKLHAWLVHIKRDYARYNRKPESATMTAEQKKVLEYFHVPLTHRGDDHWNRFYSILESYKSKHGHVLVPRVCEIPGLGDWVADQRRQYKSWKLGKASQMTKDRQERLENLGFTWQVRCRPEWDQRYAELLEYQKKFGDCKVPQHYSDNRALGKWVAKQREQFRLKKRGQHSFLTPDREEKLNAVGFIWHIRSVKDNGSGGGGGGGDDDDKSEKEATETTENIPSTEAIDSDPVTNSNPPTDPIPAMPTPLAVVAASNPEAATTDLLSVINEQQGI